MQCGTRSRDARLPHVLPMIVKSLSKFSQMLRADYRSTLEGVTRRLDFSARRWWLPRRLSARDAVVIGRALRAGPRAHAFPTLSPCGLPYNRSRSYSFGQLMMIQDLPLLIQFVSEMMANHYEQVRTPEPDLVMSNPASLAEYRAAGLPDGNGSSVYIFNSIVLSSIIRPGDLVVDLACGPANLLVYLARLHPEARFLGVDLSAEMLTMAEDLRLSTGVTNVRFMQADITALEGIASSSANVVMSTLSLHHLPTLEHLGRCFDEIARIVVETGHVHLMDFAALKRSASVEYFSTERTKGLGKFLVEDYRNSLRAAFRLDDLARLLPRLQKKQPAVVLHKTAGVPFMTVLTSVVPRFPAVAENPAIAEYWKAMKPSQRKDFSMLRLLFGFDGYRISRPC